MWALRDVSLGVERGEIHALLGPNGAGKTTLLRTISGLVDANEGTVLFHGVPAQQLSERRRRELVGLVPSGDRSFYLRISGTENLVFFARMHGLRRAHAVERARECLRAVDLAEAARKWVGVYSHGMQKRLSVARALLMEPSILLVDEATHDLDPEGAQRVRELVADVARRGAGVIWATQRVEEIRSFADRVTLLHQGAVRFSGSVPDLLATAPAHGYLLHLRDGTGRSAALLRTARAALGGRGTISASSGLGDEHYLVSLREEVTLGEALAALMKRKIQVLACREERPEIERAFLRLTEEDGS
jgi:ABC-type multidrug transport system ATPase subunit